MRAIDATDTIGRVLKKIVDEDRFTGDITIRINCNQGGIRNIKTEVAETRVVSCEFSGEKKKTVDILTD